MNWIRRNGQVEGLGQGADGPGLGQAGDALDQDVAAGQEGDDQPLEQRPLADDQAFHPLDEAEQALLGRDDAAGGEAGSSMDIESVGSGCVIGIRSGDRSPVAATVEAAGPATDRPEAMTQFSDFDARAAFHQPAEDIVGGVAGVLERRLGGPGPCLACSFWAFLAA